MNSSPRQFALHVVQRLQRDGYRAFWAGGCVRDRLLGRKPKDFDVATNATPDEIRRVFRRHRTLSIGAAFGVVVVVGPRGAGQIEVATFRCDATYSDGRHPDRVTFSSPEQDAQRRDFTINGIFYDPIRDQVIDYVGGQQDLHDKVIRAIGDPAARIAEDKLRMLRAVRFAAHFQFQLDRQTKQAVCAGAKGITAVSAERIAEEMRRMLVDPNRTAAIGLLRETGLLVAILPEAERFCSSQGQTAWNEMLRITSALASPTFPTALAALLCRLDLPSDQAQTGVDRICRRWRLANQETDLVRWMLAHENTIRSASRVPWPRLQPILVSNEIDQLLQLAAAVAQAVDGDLVQVDYCRQKLELPPEQLDPAPLITGDDLIAQEIPPGKEYKTLLAAVRDAQLEGQVSTRQQALDMVDRLRKEQQFHGLL